MDWLSSNSSISSRVACGEHISNIIRHVAYEGIEVSTSVSAVLKNIEQVPDRHKCWLPDASGTLQR
jgi:hypothetical protein